MSVGRAERTAPAPCFSRQLQEAVSTATNRDRFLCGGAALVRRVADPRFHARLLMLHVVVPTLWRNSICRGEVANFALAVTEALLVCSFVEPNLACSGAPGGTTECVHGSFPMLIVSTSSLILPALVLELLHDLFTQPDHHRHSELFEFCKIVSVIYHKASLNLTIFVFLAALRAERSAGCKVLSRDSYIMSVHLCASKVSTIPCLRVLH